MRIALKIAYDGTKFHGFAIQPKVRTIEAEIIQSLLEIKAISHRSEAKFQLASRTDKGVSAKGNVVAFNTNYTGEKIAHCLASLLEDIWIIGVATVEQTFNPRYAYLRWYRYYLSADSLDVDEMMIASLLFVGMHDFTNFAKKEKNTLSGDIDDIEINRYSNVLFIDVKAQRFFWNQIRRIVAALEKVGKGQVTLKEVEYALKKPCHRCSFGIAPPEYLILMDVEYKNVKFMRTEKHLRDVENLAHYYRIKRMMLDAIRE